MTKNCEACFVVLSELTMRVAGNFEGDPDAVHTVTVWHPEGAFFSVDHAQEWARNNVGFFGRPWKIVGALALTKSQEGL